MLVNEKIPDYFGAENLIHMKEAISVPRRSGKQIKSAGKAVKCFDAHLVS